MGWQSNREGPWIKHSTSSPSLLCSPSGPIYGTLRTRVLRFTLGGSFLAIVAPVRGIISERDGERRGMLSLRLQPVRPFRPATPGLYVSPEHLQLNRVSRPVFFRK